MGKYKEMDIEIQELSRHPAFKKAVHKILNDVLVPIMENLDKQLWDIVSNQNVLMTAIEDLKEQADDSSN